MLVWTKDDGYQPVRWIGTRQMSETDLEAHPKVRPIRIKAGALGQNMPERNLTVSPQHRILVNSKLARRLHGDDEMLVAAKHLLQVEGVDVELDMDSVTMSASCLIGIRLWNQKGQRRNHCLQFEKR